MSSPWYGEPQYWERSSSLVSGSVKIHPSRVVKFVGAERLDTLGRSTFWGDSVLQVVAEAIMSAGLVTSGGAQLVSEAKVDVINVPGLTENIANRTYENNLKKRFAVANAMKGLYSLLLLDGKETWNRLTANFGGVPDMLKMYLLIASGALDIPATRFLSQSPAGLSATGDSDIRNYYDKVRSEQNLRITPAMSVLDEVLIRSALGTRPPQLYYEWVSLWQRDEATEADIESKRSTVFTADLDSGLFPEDIMRKARMNQLVESGFYPGLETIVQEWEDENGPLDEWDGDTATDPTPPVDPETGLPVAANQNLPVEPDISGRVRQATSDAAPRQLYVRRERGGR